MNNTEQHFIGILRSLEPEFYKAGQIAKAKQATATSQNKKDTGVDYVDIVTEADLAVQEAVLQACQKTDLIQCHLVAEEDTLTTKFFQTTGDIILTIDPIDGTKLYASGGDFYTLLIGLHNAQEVLYSFCHYPSLGWTTVMTGSDCEVIGKPGELIVPTGSDKIIAYSYGDPQTAVPELYQQLTSEGYQFRSKRELSDIAGSTALLLAKKVGGLFLEDPLAVDGLAGLHFGLTQNYRVFSGDRAGGQLNLGTIVDDPANGPRHQGFYLVVKP